MRRFFALAAMLFVLLPIVAIEPSTLNLTRLKGVDELTDNRCCLEDSCGFLWIGTTSGLHCYDGRHEYAFVAADETGAGQTSLAVSSLLEDGSRLWVGTSDGLYILHRNLLTSNASLREQRRTVNPHFERFARRTRYGVVVSSEVTRLMRTRQGDILICTSGQGLFAYSPDEDVLIQDSRHGSFVSDAVETADGHVFFASMDQGAIVEISHDGQIHGEFRLPDYHYTKHPLRLFRSGADIYIGLRHTLYRYRQGGGMETAATVPTEGFIQHIAEADVGQLFLSTTQGLWLYDTRTGEMKRCGNGTAANKRLSSQSVRFVSNTQGRIGILTDAGIDYSDPRLSNMEFTPLPPAQGSGEARQVTAFCYLKDRRTLFVGTTAGLYYGNDDNRILRPCGALGGEAVTALCQDGDQLLVGTAENGLAVLSIADGDPAFFRRHVYSADEPYTLSSNTVNSIMRLKSGRVIVATSWGLDFYDRASNCFRHHAAIGANIDFTDIVEDAQRSVSWASTRNNGLFLYEQESSQWQNYSPRNKGRGELPTTNINCLHLDRDGRLWVGTTHGLFTYDEMEDGFQAVSPQTGTVVALGEDQYGVLWMADNRGVEARKAGNLMLLSLSFDEDLMHGRVQPRAIAQANGLMLFGTEDGFYAIRPTEENAQQDLTLYLWQLRLLFDDANQSRLQELGLNQPLIGHREIWLPYTDNSFELSFASPRFTTRIDYEYMLEGVDKDWTHCNDAGTAVYNALQPGHYTLRLRNPASPDKEETYRITILPPWWRTTWAYIGYALLAILLGYLVVRRYQGKLKRHYERQLQRYIDEKDKELFRSKIHFFVSLVHEMRTPLSLISLPLERIEESNQDQETQRLTNIIHRNLDYLLGVVNKLLDFQKFEREEQEDMQVESVSLSSLMREVEGQFRSYAEINQRQLLVELPEEDILTGTDREKVTRILINLVNNAVKYSHSRIRLSLTRQDERALIEVSDDGDGIPEEKREKIFDSFYRMDDAVTQLKPGTGLGLSVARMLAGICHGTLAVGDSPMGGACFTLELPIVPVEPCTMPLTPAPSSIVEGEEPLEELSQQKETRRFTVLMVEDNEDLREMTARSLRKWYRTVTACDGQEALETLEREEVDVIVSDVMMPNMDGNELCRRVKNNINTSHIAFVLLTAKTTVQNKVEGMESGADAFVEKPFALRQLHLQIENLIKTRQRFHRKMQELNGNTTEALENASEYGLTEYDANFIETLQQEVRKHLSDEGFSYDTLAAELSMSRSSLYRKIKLLIGQSPQEYLKSQRMIRAAELIRKGLRISDVMLDVGFTSSSYFAKCFRAAYGVLPKDYK